MPEQAQLLIIYPPASPAAGRLAGHYASLTDATSSLKAALRKGGRSDAEPTMKAPCRNLVVGRASSSCTSTLNVFTDRLEYKFHHDHHGQVQMLMWFRDVDAAALDMSSLTLTFHVCRPLRHFGSDYDPGSGQDRLVLQFFQSADAVAFCRHAGHVLTKG